jgi:hypothetical protein
MITEELKKAWLKVNEKCLEVNVDRNINEFELYNEINGKDLEVLSEIPLEVKFKEVTNGK